MALPTCDIALALVHRDAHWLVARRRAGTHLGGLWEFPGGKRRADESVAAAALRELYEETAVTARVERELAVVTHTYTDRIVHLWPVVCRWKGGEAAPRAAEECRWATLDELRRLPMPPANAALLTQLPPLQH